MTSEMNRTRSVDLVLRTACGVCMGVFFACSSVKADGRLSYNRDVRPVLADKCFACHGADSAARRADLRLDRRQNALEMGAIEPGDVDSSELISRIVTEDHDVLMPPPELKKPLKPEEVELLKRWVAEGAEYEEHWSFLKPQRAELPKVSDANWPKSPIDYFVLSRLQQQGLAPAPEADPQRLFRRLHLDITGLPPDPPSVQQFVGEYQDEGDAALERWITKLLESPKWGEHQARFWLDAAYGDTHGLHFDNYREMWPYRDWVIRANANLPFDQFTAHQLAGDLLPSPTQDQLIATGFQRCNITTNESGTIAEEVAAYAADRVQTLGWVYMGLTTNCSQCHDHKFDPFTMKGYYSLAAYFRNTTQEVPSTAMWRMEGGLSSAFLPKRTCLAGKRFPTRSPLPSKPKARKLAVQDDFKKRAVGPFTRRDRKDGARR